MNPPCSRAIRLNHKKNPTVRGSKEKHIHTHAGGEIIIAAAFTSHTGNFLPLNKQTFPPLPSASHKKKSTSLPSCPRTMTTVWSHHSLPASCMAAAATPGLTSHTHIHVFHTEEGEFGYICPFTKNVNK